MGVHLGGGRILLRLHHRHHPRLDRLRSRRVGLYETWHLRRRLSLFPRGSHTRRCNSCRHCPSLRRRLKSLSRSSLRLSFSLVAIHWPFAALWYSFYCNFWS